MLGSLGLVVLILLIFVGGGLFGWVVQGFQKIISFLVDGCWSSIGCMLWIIFGLIILLAII